MKDSDLKDPKYLLQWNVDPANIPPIILPTMKLSGKTGKLKLPH